MTEILFIQGAGPEVHEKWDIHLVESLRRQLGPRYAIRYPRMPNEEDPTMATWGPVLERELAALPPGAVLVGHSAGGTMAVRAIAHAPAPVALGGIVLVAAPFIGEGGWASDELAPGGELGDRLPATVPVLLYHGEDDDIVPVEHVQLYAAAIPWARVFRLAGRDHQLGNDMAEVARGIGALHPWEPEPETEG